MKEKLEKIIGLDVLEGELLKNYTTFKIGGPAKFFVRVNNKAYLHKSLLAAKELGLPFFVLGGGSNVLVSDKGFDGVVIKLDSGEPEFKSIQITAFAGDVWSLLIKEAVKTGLSGLEFGANIPGTVGGAIYGNAGAYGKGAGDYVAQVEVFDVSSADEITLKVLTREECQFAYRESIFKQNKNWVIAEVLFRLDQDDKAVQKLKEIDKEWQKRVCTQPLTKPSAGCSFKNIVYTPELEKFKEWEIKGKLPAAKFIENLGLKGMKIGGAMISDIHANFILNNKEASADDVVQLISLVKTKVRDKFGIQLQEEVQYVGF